MKKEYKLNGGPLDGDIVTVDTDDGNHFIFPVNNAPDLFVCYEIKDDKLVYVTSKTRQQLMDENL